MKHLKSPFLFLLGALVRWTNRFGNYSFRHTNTVALGNSLGLLNECGVESLFVDPASTNLPFANRYLIIQRGASGYQYGDVCAGGPGGAYPLGVSSDSPYAVGDILNVRRFSARPGLEIGLGVASKTVTIDKLLVSAAGGCVQDVTTLTANGTYWVVGRAAASLTTTGSTQEVTFVPCEPYQIINTSGTLTFPTNPA